MIFSTMSREIDIDWMIPSIDCEGIQYRVEFRQLGEDVIFVDTENNNITFAVPSPPCSELEVIVTPIFNDKLQLNPTTRRSYVSK